MGVPPMHTGRMPVPRVPARGFARASLIYMVRCTRLGRRKGRSRPSAAWRRVMSEWSFINEGWFVYTVLPLLIFCARITDVTLGTMRIIFVNRGGKFVAPLLGCAEALIWVLAASQVMKHLTNPLCYLSYGAGFATGTYVGMLIEERMAMGMLTVRIILNRGNSHLQAALRQAGHGVTVVEGQGVRGPVNMLFVVIRRRLLPSVVNLIHQHAPDAFYSTEEVRAAAGGTLMQPTGQGRRRSALRRPAGRV